MTDVKYPKRWPFAIAGAFMIIREFIFLLSNFELIMAIGKHGPEILELGTILNIFVCPLLCFVLGVVMISSKNSIGTIALLGVYMAISAYWLIDAVKYFIEHVSIHNASSLLCSVFWWLAIVSLFLIALVSRINQKNGLVKVWFIPFLFSFLQMLAIIVNWSMLLVNRFDFEYAVRFVFNLLGISSQMFALLFFGLGLKMAMNKRPAVKVVSGVNQNQMNANVRPERDRETNIPSFGATVQMPKPSPIMQPATAPQQEKRTSDDEMIEIRKFKQLLDDGIITEEEFNRKKQELLGL